PSRSPVHTRRMNCRMWLASAGAACRRLYPAFGPRVPPRAPWKRAAPGPRSQGGIFSSGLFTASRQPALADELDADRPAATPDHFTVAAGPCVARERQPQFGGQRVLIVDRE